MSEYFDKLKKCNFRDGGSPKSVVSLDDVALGERNGIEHQLLWNML